MQHYTAEEMKKDKRSEIAEHYKGYTGRNLQGLFAVKTVDGAVKNHLSLPKEEAKVVDFGTASGIFLKQLHENGFRNLYALDIDDYIDDENRPLIKEVKTANCNHDTLPWSDNSFDIATAWCVLPHLENPHHCIRETARILKPGGLFILSIPHLLSRASVQYFLKHKDFARYHPEKDHITAFTPGVFKIAISKYFEPVEMKYLIDERSLRGIKGKIRKSILNIARKHPALKKYFEERWGYNQVWILKKLR